MSIRSKDNNAIFFLTYPCNLEISTRGHELTFILIVISCSIYVGLENKRMADNLKKVSLKFENCLRLFNIDIVFTYIE